MSSEHLHEPKELLSEETRNMHRALTSLIEELEAIDWYQQRAEACSDTALRAVLLHNRNEEIEHAAMTLEWIRRQSKEMDVALRTYVGTSGDITKLEHETKGESPSAPSRAEPTATSQPSLGIGSLRAPPSHVHA
jgi:ferritin-like protein